LIPKIGTAKRPTIGAKTMIRILKIKIHGSNRINKKIFPIKEHSEFCIRIDIIPILI